MASSIGLNYAYLAGFDWKEAIDYSASIKMKSPVADDHIQTFRFADHGDSLFNSAFRQVWVNAANRRLKISQQQNLAVIGPFRRLAIGRQVWPVANVPAAFGKPRQALLFELIFRHIAVLLPGGLF